MTEYRYDTRAEVQQAPLVNLFTNPTAQNNTSDWTGVNLASFVRQASGQPSYTGTAFRLNGSASSSDSYIQTTWAGLGPLETGKQYTVSGNLNLGGALAGTANTYARRIIVGHRIGAAAYTIVQSTQAANAAGDTRLSVSFTLPPGTTEAFIRYYHGHAGTSTAFWYHLLLNEGTNTSYFDGGYPTSSHVTSFTGIEVGWDGTPGNSSSRRVDRSQNVTLDDCQLVQISYDSTRVPYIDATFEMPTPDAAILAMLDPRRPAPVVLNFAATHYHRGTPGADLTTPRSWLPMGYSAGSAGKLFVRSLIRDHVSGRLTIRAASAEVILEDKKRIAGNTLDTGATNVAELWTYAVVDAGEASNIGSAGGTAAYPVPAGDRRLWLSGESASSVFESEAGAVDYRHYGTDTGQHQLSLTTQAPFWNTPATDLEDGADGTIVTATEEFTRTEWRDATLVAATYDNASGVRVTEYQRFPASGANRKGEVTSIDRALPSANYADYVTRRAQRRGGLRITVVAHCDFLYRPTGAYTLTIDGQAVTFRPLKVTYRPEVGTMELEGTTSL